MLHKPIKEHRTSDSLMYQLKKLVTMRDFLSAALKGICDEAGWMGELKLAVNTVVMRPVLARHLQQ